MIDWTKPMRQSFEYVEIDPDGWKHKRVLDDIKSCSISYDADSETVGSASLDTTNDKGEMYIRTYLVVTQNRITERYPLGTFIYQSGEESYGKGPVSVSMNGYSPIHELEGDKPDVGYSIIKGSNIMSYVYRIMSEHMRAPITPSDSDSKLEDNFVANGDDTYLSFILDLIALSDFKVDLDGEGNVTFVKRAELENSVPIWTYTDDNSSILYPEIKKKYDIYGIPNVLEVVYSKTDTKNPIIVRIENNDENSPVSIPRRGRRILVRDTDPKVNGAQDINTLTEYAKKTLKELSTLTRVVSYKHGYCPVKVGDCVMLNYRAAGLVNVKAQVMTQSISCEPGCPVEETAKYTEELWSY